MFCKIKNGYWIKLEPESMHEIEEDISTLKFLDNSNNKEQIQKIIKNEISID